LKLAAHKRTVGGAWYNFLTGNMNNRPTTPANIMVVIVWSDIKDIDAFKAVADKTIQITKKEGGTRFYTYSYSEDNSVCFGMDGYSSITALQQHVANVGNVVPEFLDIAVPTAFVVQCTVPEDIPGVKALLPQAIVVSLGNGIAK
jgi:hypothetical protein